MKRFLIGFAAILGFGSAVLGCPKGACFLEVCTNGNCSCAVDSCVDGATFDTTRRTCACDTDRLSVSGQCLTQADADAFCGKGYTYAANPGGQPGCTKKVCAATESLDEATGVCVPATAVAGNMGVQVGAGETIQCPAGTTLVVQSGNGACVPTEQTCAPDEQWNGQACTKVGQCGTGSQWDAAQGKCVAYASQGDDAAIVDVNQWATTAFGPNGGTGTSTFCNKFARYPWSFGIPAGQAATVQVAVQLAFPGGDVRQAIATTTPSYVGNPIAVPAKGKTAVQTAADEVLATLKKGGGRASQGQAATIVKCLVRNAAPPVVVPATGGV
ncbi:MAG: hypothetical protein KC731_32910 [Myxococcales bacterium]|nr:hypothetical protein [Myxococcales bacterium]